MGGGTGLYTAERTLGVFSALKRRALRPSMLRNASCVRLCSRGGTKLSASRVMYWVVRGSEHLDSLHLTYGLIWLPNDSLQWPWQPVAPLIRCAQPFELLICVEAMTSTGPTCAPSPLGYGQALRDAWPACVVVYPSSSLSNYKTESVAAYLRRLWHRHIASPTCSGL